MSSPSLMQMCLFDRIWLRASARWMGTGRPCARPEAMRSRHAVATDARQRRQREMDAPMAARSSALHRTTWIRQRQSGSRSRRPLRRPRRERCGIAVCSIATPAEPTWHPQTGSLACATRAVVRCRICGPESRERVDPSNRPTLSMGEYWAIMFHLSNAVEVGDDGDPAAARWPRVRLPGGRTCSGEAPARERDGSR